MLDNIMFSAEFKDHKDIQSFLYEDVDGCIFCDHNGKPFHKPFQLILWSMYLSGSHFYVIKFEETYEFQVYMWLDIFEDVDCY